MGKQSCDEWVVLEWAQKLGGSQWKRWTRNEEEEIKYMYISRGQTASEMFDVLMWEWLTMNFSVSVHSPRNVADSHIHWDERPELRGSIWCFIMGVFNSNFKPVDIIGGKDTQNADIIIWRQIYSLSEKQVPRTHRELWEWRWHTRYCCMDPFTIWFI